MENIKGYTHSEIEKMDSDTKDRFGELVLKFGFSSIILTNCVNCDLHAGNLFYYIDENEYRLGIIDFGICYFPNKEEQKEYFNFFNKFLITEDYNNLVQDCLGQFLEPKNVIDNMSSQTKNKFEEEIIYGVVEYAKKFQLVKYFTYINVLLDKYKLNLSGNFQKIVLSFQIGSNLAKTLCKDVQISEKKLFKEIAHLFNILNIDE